MPFVIRLIFAVMLFISSAVYAEEGVPTEKPKEEEAKILKIIVWGDGLTSGEGVSKYRDFSATLERKLYIQYFENYNIINRSIDGQTTAYALRDIRDIINEKPDAVILALGVTDVKRNISLQEIYKNLAIIITTLQTQKITILLMGAEPPAGSAEEYDGKFAGMYKYLANQYKVPLHADFLNGVAGDPSLNQSDGFYPNQMGVEKMVDGAMPVVVKMVRYLQGKAKKQEDN